jgi:hypothetical protein
MYPKVLRKATASATVLLVLCEAPAAHAYNWRTHSRIVEVATGIMAQSYGSTADYAAPAGVDPTQWATFLAQGQQAVKVLNTLQSGLPDASQEDAQACGYCNNQDMSQIPFDRIKDLNYLALKGGYVDGFRVQRGMTIGDLESPSSCSLLPVCSSGLCPPNLSTTIIPCPASEANADTGLQLGRALGWQAASVDGNLEDTEMWDRPTSSAAVNLLEDAIAVPPISTFFVGTAATGATVVVFFECLADLLIGNSCSGAVTSALNLVDDVSPVNILSSAIQMPGFDIGNPNTSYVGVWHFEDAAMFASKTDTFNPNNENYIRGIIYDEAGLTGDPGFLDTLISAGVGDIAGYTLDPGGSAGVAKYGPYDQVQHNSGDWNVPFGHLEFSALDSLAEYGMFNFAASPSLMQSAFYLSYPLHALGDAAEPHHATGTTGNGHRPYEDAIDDLLDAALLPPPVSCALLRNNFYDADAFVGGYDPQVQRILASAFADWQKYIQNSGLTDAGGFKVSNVPVRQMVQDLAVSTYNVAEANNSTIFNDSLSNEYYFGTPVDIVEDVPLDLGAALAAAGCAGSAEVCASSGSTACADLLASCPAAVASLLTSPGSSGGAQAAVAAYESLIYSVGPSPITLTAAGQAMQSLLEGSSAMTIALLMGVATDVSQANPGGLLANPSEYKSGGESDGGSCGTMPPSMTLSAGFCVANGPCEEDAGNSDAGEDAEAGGEDGGPSCTPCSSALPCPAGYVCNDFCCALMAPQ